MGKKYGLYMGKDGIQLNRLKIHEEIINELLPCSYSNFKHKINYGLNNLDQFQRITNILLTINATLKNVLNKTENK